MTQNQNGKAALAGLVGAGAAALLMAMVPSFEGEQLVGYLDPAGIPTKCFGDTSNVTVGMAYTEAQCLASLSSQLLKHSAGVLKCVPQLKGRDNQTAASVSFAYNIGVSAFCNSTTAARFRAGKWAAGCRAINESDTGRPQWVTSKGKVLPGLVRRRAAERALCEKGLPNE